MFNNITCGNMKNYDLYQGEKFLNNKNSLEGFDNDNTNTNVDNIKNLDTEFNQVLTLYTKNYQLLMQELMNNNKYNAIIQKYGGKNVLYNGDKYFINKYGFAHKYENEQSWTTRSNSCSSNPITIPADDFNKLIKSVNMGEGQECNVAGFNIQNKSTSEKAWVDIEGRKHIYGSVDMWSTRNKSCFRDPKVLDDSLYKTIPKYTDMTKSSICNTLNIDPKILDNLSNLNEKLLNLAKKLLVNIEQLKTEDKSIKTNLAQIKNNISSTVNNLQNDKTNFDFSTNNQNIEVQNKLIDSELRVTSSYTKYIIWCIVCFIVVGLTYYIFISDDVPILVYIVIAILLLYIIYYEILPRLKRVKVSY